MDAELNISTLVEHLQFSCTTLHALHYEPRESHFIFMKNNTKAPTKQSQHINATYCNTVRHNMLSTSGDPVVSGCNMFGIGGSNLIINTPHVTTIAACWVLPGD